MSHIITGTTDNNILIAEKFLQQARRWVTIVYNATLVCIRRSMADWKDKLIECNAERLFDLAAEFWRDECLVNFFRV